ncbi:MAG: N-acetylmuramoyl-L-alanine amidase [Candidatus Ozemobacteraceae bacterium]
MKRQTFFRLSVFVLLSVFVTFFGLQLEAGFSPLAGLVIMLDPGHGGEDSGAIGSGGLKESAVNLRVARYLSQLLQADGATVLMTREEDKTVTLQERVDLASQKKPDLFVSIHHNASLGKTKVNRGEIYFNALDNGLPLDLAKHMSKELGATSLASGSSVIPGGFFVLRKNSVPALLTEASYISVPENEKALSTGRALTQEALVFRRAIRQVFDHPIMRAEVISPNPARTSSPFFNLMVSSDRTIAKAEIRFDSGTSVALGFDVLPSLGHFYKLFNLKPLPPGKHDLRLVFYGGDGSISTVRKVSVLVTLPVSEVTLLPIAPYIPEGYKGVFPLRLLLKDADGRVNPQALPFHVELGNHVVNGMTRPDGQAAVAIDLDGTERGNVNAKAVIDGGIAAIIQIPVQVPVKAFILGKISTNVSGEGLERTRVRYGRDRMTITGPGGYFFCELSNIFRNLEILIQPPSGYPTERRMIRTGGAWVVKPEIVLAPVAPGLLGKKIAILADNAQDEWIRPLIGRYMRGGARIFRLKASAESPNPVASAVAEANRQTDLNLLLSFKRDDVSAVTMRHYYKSQGGMSLGKSVAQALSSMRLCPAPKVTPGSDYELGHTGVTAMTVVLPRQTPPNVPVAVAEALYRVLAEAPAK